MPELRSNTISSIQLLGSKESPHLSSHPSPDRFQSERRYFGPVLAALLGLALPFGTTAQTDESEPITFDRALRIATERSPRVQLLEAQLEVAAGQIEQARLRPNPTLGAELENVLGTGKLEGVDRAELTIGISQLIERREKREKRAEAVEQRQELLRWDYEEAISALRYEVRNTFSQALVAQRDVALQTELLELARSSEAEVERRAAAATASAIELSQARLATQRQAFELSQTERQLRETKTALAALWNEPTASSYQLAGTLELETALPSLAELIDLIDTTPYLARYPAERRAQSAIVEREQAEAKADFNLFGGIKYFREGGDDAAFVVGIDIPWKIRDRNQGNIRSARAGLSLVESQRQLDRRQAVQSVAVAYRELSGALEEWQNLSDQLLPAAKTALEETQSGYEQGIITLLNVLEARRALFEIRSEMLDATGRYLIAEAVIQRLTEPSSANNL